MTFINIVYEQIYYFIKYFAAFMSIFDTVCLHL